MTSLLASVREDAEVRLALPHKWVVPDQLLERDRALLRAAVREIARRVREKANQVRPQVPTHADELEVIANFIEGMTE